MLEFQLNNCEKKQIKRALVSVYDKHGLDVLARALDGAGVEIVSTGSTCSAIEALGIKVVRVEEVTNFPECLDGRVKTLHPHIHAGILADVENAAHKQTLEELEVEPFDLVVVNLYPFVETVNAGAEFSECVEKIDIGGPSMIRAAAKNFSNVAVVSSLDDYGDVFEKIAAGGLTIQDRFELAKKAFQYTAAYDVAVANWFSKFEDGIPTWFASAWSKKTDLHYGENSHQRAAVYLQENRIGASEHADLATAKQLGGKEMSYNNYTDAGAALRVVLDFGSPAVAVVKHSNPCGVALGRSVVDAYVKAFASDPVSAYGGVVATNRAVTKEMAEALSPVFTEVIVAPKYNADALEILRQKKNLRILEVGAELGGSGTVQPELRHISGGLLLQDSDVFQAPGDDVANWTLASGAPANTKTLEDLEFAWRVVRSVKSNAVLLAVDKATVGIGMGQVNRLDSCGLAISRANELGKKNSSGTTPQRAVGSVAASDAFFPFADGVLLLIDAGVRAVVQPGGSIRDEEVINAARDANITMYFTGARHFAH
ncbi:MAG: bifunctional phosphoribosylaminoimidazolecarboxamide formyltransferase/IMP cyclohydrolase [Candidatus Ancillula trichonymphae]|nr:bifunctional phosphoribosylaminoimidazolecarboxamide formyltransferase/IMP cyclohydrolase [Candidatus Ancillula trichonymphae]